jgi:starvation-inducible outer membrane lipoprotein
MKRALALSSLLILAACSNPPQQAANNRDTMTRRQKDSVLAQSGLPGAKGVGMAQKAADAEKARVAALDSASKP